MFENGHHWCTEQTVFEIAAKMVYASSQEAYQALRTQVTTDVPNEVVKYFNTNWHPLRNERVMDWQIQCGRFLKKNNNRLKCLNCKLKYVITLHSTLENFVDNFFAVLATLRTE